ncbi:hypothetical protein LZ32DRAFT_330530 [Colletotrichum eremochloae]|nr:hypothetical protein LZ32DRAFT_330530 [Colletotrichum eremochloae]
MCQPCRTLFPERYGPRRELEETPVHNNEEEEEEEEEEGEYCPPSPTASIVEKTIVQPAPSHDGAPTFAAFQVPENLETEDEIRPVRPPFAIVIYDATHTACATRSARFARALFDGTLHSRRSRDWLPDRFEVVTLPLPLSLSDDERVEACIRHHEKEFQSRLMIADKTEAASWFLPERIMDMWYARRILILNRFEAGSDDINDTEVAPWEEVLHIEKTWNGSKIHPDANRLGSFLEVDWQPRKHDPRTNIWLRAILFDMFLPAVPFYNHFVPDGVLNRQLEEARKS